MASTAELRVRVGIASLLAAAEIAKGFNPNQARAPKGSPNGGKWTKLGGAFAGAPEGYGAHDLFDHDGKPTGKKPFHTVEKPGSARHPFDDDKGLPVFVHRPTKPGDMAAWGDPDAVATVVPGGEVPAELGGVPFTPWEPGEGYDWSKVPGTDPSLEADMPDLDVGHQRPAAGVILQEDDGRIWLTRPTNGFGGYQHTFPKGSQEKGLTLQQTAVKEMWEETGLQVELTGVFGDYKRTTSVGRYYLARRVGGTPKAMGWESQALRLVPPAKLHDLVNMKVDHEIVRDLLHDLDLRHSVKKARASWLDGVSLAALTKALPIEERIDRLHERRGDEIAFDVWIDPDQARIDAKLDEMFALTKGWDEDKHPRWPPGSPLGGQFKKVGADGITEPPTIGSAANPAYAKKAAALHGLATTSPGDLKPVLDGMGLDAKAAAIQAKAKGGAKLNSNDKWWLQLHQYAQQLQTEVGGKVAGEAKVAAVAQKVAAAKGDAAPLTLSALKKTGGKPGGSNPGGMYVDQAGSKVLVKGSNGGGSAALTEARARNEVLASKLLAAAGVGAPKMEVVDLQGQYGGGVGVASYMIDGGHAVSPTSKADVAAARADFAVHAWLANYDAIGTGYDNTRIVDGKAVNIDPGGALLFRAQGAEKYPGSNGKMPSQVAEWEGMRDPAKNHYAAAIYAGMTASELKASAQKVADITPATITALVDTYAAKTVDKAALANSLAMRRLDIMAKAGIEGPQAAKGLHGASLEPAPAPKKADVPVSFQAEPGNATGATITADMTKHEMYDSGAKAVENGFEFAGLIPSSDMSTTYGQGLAKDMKAQAAAHNYTGMTLNAKAGYQMAATPDEKADAAYLAGMARATIEAKSGKKPGGQEGTDADKDGLIHEADKKGAGLSAKATIGQKAVEEDWAELANKGDWTALSAAVDMMKPVAASTKNADDAKLIAYGEGLLADKGPVTVFTNPFSPKNAAFHGKAAEMIAAHAAGDLGPINTQLELQHMNSIGLSWPPSDATDFGKLVNLELAMKADLEGGATKPVSAMTDDELLAELKAPAGASVLNGFVVDPVPTPSAAPARQQYPTTASGWSKVVTDLNAQHGSTMSPKPWGDFLHEVATGKLSKDNAVTGITHPGMLAALDMAGAAHDAAQAKLDPLPEFDMTGVTGEDANGVEMPAGVPKPTFTGAAADYWTKQAEELDALAAKGDVEALSSAHLKPSGAKKGEPKYSTYLSGPNKGQPKSPDAKAFVAYQAALVAQATGVKAAADTAKVNAAVAEAVQLATPMQHPPKVGDVGHGKLPAPPSFEMAKLPESNTNAASHNAKVTAIMDAMTSGKANAILAMKFGTNTYAKKQVKLANDTLAAMGVVEQVTAGQKANSHPALTGGVTAAQALATAKNEGLSATAETFVPEAPKKIIPALPDAKLPQTIDYLNAKGPGQGLSSKAWVNQQNADLQAQMVKLAKAGDYAALKAMTYPELNKETGAPTGKTLPIDDHPAKGLGQFHDSAIAAMDEILHPPEPLKEFDAKTAASVHAITQAFPAKPLATALKHAKANEKLGYYVALGVAKPVDAIKPAKTMPLSSTAISNAHAAFKAMDPMAKKFISNIQSSSAMGKAFQTGAKEFGGVSMEALAKAAHKAAVVQPEGTTIYKWINATDLDTMMKAQPGTVMQSPSCMCASYSPTATKGFGNSLIEFVHAKGAKSLLTFGSGGFAGEKEVSILPNSRFVLLSAEKGGPHGAQRHVRLLVLPPDPTLDK